MKMMTVTLEHKIINGSELFSINRKYGYKMDSMTFCVGDGHKNGFYACGINDTGFFDSIEKPCKTVDEFARAVFQV